MFKVSVIIATHNRQEHLKKCLESLLVQEYDGSFSCEFIVADNNSTDGTKDVVNGYQPQFNGRLKYLMEPVQGKSFALNAGIGQAQGDIVAFTDDDAVVDAKWLLSLMDCFETFDCDGVGGRVLPIYPKNTPQWIKEDKNKMAGITVTCDNGEDSQEFKNGMHGFLGANYAFKRSVFDEVGYFRTDLGPGLSKPTTGEDREFVDRLMKKNMRVVYCGQALIWHPVDLNRTKLKNVAKWNISLGRVAARHEYERNSEGIVYWCGMPRYLIKGVVQDFLLIFPNIFSRKSLFNSLRSFFRKVGMIMEYRENLTVRFKGERSHAQG